MNTLMRHSYSGKTLNHLHHNNHLESPWPPTECISSQASDITLWPTVEPRVWTSVPTRRNDFNSQEIIYIPSRDISRNLTVAGVAYGCCTSSYAYVNEGIRQTVQTKNDYPNTCFLSAESEIPHTRSFQVNGFYDTESPYSEYIDSFHLNYGDCSNESEEDDISDTYDNTEPEHYNNVNEQSAVMGNHGNLPITLSDLDCILRMLPCHLIERDIFLKHVTDEEVALIMYNRDDDDEDEEIVSLNIMHEDVYDVRLPNPVACLLERSASEYFLPIVCDTLKDKKDKP